MTAQPHYKQPGRKRQHVSIITDPSRMPSLSGTCKEDLPLAAPLVTDTQVKERAESGVGVAWIRWSWSLLSLDSLSQRFLELLIFSSHLAYAADLTPAVWPTFISRNLTVNTGWIIGVALSHEFPTLNSSHPRSPVFVPGEWLYYLAQHQVHSGFLCYLNSLCPNDLHLLLILFLNIL